MFSVVDHIVNDLQRQKSVIKEVVQVQVANNSLARQRQRLGARQLAVYHRQLLGRLVTGVGAALGKGAPVIGVVVSRVPVNRDSWRLCNSWRCPGDVESGPDLSRMIVREKPATPVKRR